MAWYNSGTWDGVEIERGATILSQILYSINERQSIQGKSLTTWGAPVSTTYPSASNCVMTLAQAMTLFNNAQTQITNLCDAVNPGNIRFVKTDYSTQYTISSLLGEGTYGTSWLPVSTTQERGKLIIQIREALDRLIYIKWTISNGTTTDGTRNESGALSYTTTQQAWDHLSDNASFPPSYDPLVARYMHRNAGTIYNAACASTGQIDSITVPHNTGTFISGTITVQENYSGTGASADTYTVSDNEGTEYALTLSTPGTQQSVIVNKIESFWFGPTTAALTLTDSYPSTVPFGTIPILIACIRGLSIISGGIEFNVVRQLVPGTHLTYG